jgi:hypothetical protein
MRVLGSPVTYKDTRPTAKLAPRGRVGILIGYRSDGRGGTALDRVYDAAARKVVDTVDTVLL